MRLIDGCIEECLANLNVILRELDAFDTLKGLSKTGLESFCESLLDSKKFCHRAVIHITGRADNAVVTFKPVWTKDCVRATLVAIQDDWIFHNVSPRANGISG